MKCLTPAFLILLLLGISLPVQADRRDQEHGNGHGKAMSREQAARIIRQRDGGRILDIRPRGNGYEVKTLRNGRVRVYELNGDDNRGRR